MQTVEMYLVIPYTRTGVGTLANQDVDSHGHAEHTFIVFLPAVPHGKGQDVPAPARLVQSFIPSSKRHY
jgi:hypothetical protein